MASSEVNTPLYFIAVSTNTNKFSKRLVTESTAAITSRYTDANLATVQHNAVIGSLATIIPIFDFHLGQ